MILVSVSMPIFIYPSYPIQLQKPLLSNSLLSISFSYAFPRPSPPRPLSVAHPPLTTSRLTLTHTRPLALTACKNAP